MNSNAFKSCGAGLVFGRPIGKIFLVCLSAGLFFMPGKVQAQSVKTVGDPALDKYTLYNTYGPMRSVPGAFTSGPISNRHAYIFPAASLSGIPSQSMLDSLAFYKVNSGGFQGTVNLKIYLKNTASTNLGAGSLNWETEKNGATLVYDANPISAAAGVVGYKTFMFVSSFLYSGSNLEMLVEFKQMGPTTDYMSWAWDNISVSYPEHSLKFDYVLSETPPASLTSSANIHPVVRIFYTPPPVTPLKLVDFTVTKSAKGAELKWKTADEINVLGFEIEKSRDGKNFQSIGKLGAKNTAENVYEFLDADLATERAYYRLRMMDKDGKTSFSKTVLVTIDEKSGKLKVRPNPARDVLHVQLPTGVQETVALQIVDAAGKLYSRKSLQLGPGTINTTIDISQLPPGNYRLLLQGNNTKSFEAFVKM